MECGRWIEIQHCREATVWDGESRQGSVGLTGQSQTPRQNVSERHSVILCRQRETAHCTSFSLSHSPWLMRWCGHVRIIFISIVAVRNRSDGDRDCNSNISWRALNLNDQAQHHDSGATDCIHHIHIILVIKPWSPQLAT